MQKKINEFFLSNAVMVIAAAVAAACFLGDVFLGLLMKSRQEAFYAVLAFTMILLTYISYKRNDKNVMKCLIGAFLTWNILYVEQMIDLSAKKLLLEPSVGPFICLAELLLTLALFVNHLVINSDHYSSPSSVQWNQFFLAFVALLWLMYIFTASSSPGDTLSKLGLIAGAAVIICIEVKLDAFRIERESKGWTEKKK